VIRLGGAVSTPAAEKVLGDLTDASSLPAALADVDAVIFTDGDNSNAEAVNYGAVRNVLRALNGRPVRIALMTTIGVHGSAPPPLLDGTLRKGVDPQARRPRRFCHIAFRL